ncbi:type II toxin-antitoxin system RelE/ParE family toxin [Streptomyces sp. ZAF1911]|uniref:type II toxin-antitoxin system RelE/ParE family toxin n=1 Tax=Streptomyces sp. ZAF1911 TaxID=2944129 RepID=UPI00237B3B5F|nr:type II toxin-antitoxin system RelE/ParE family toxin [Streptomyces sp. ZAF1911]MDD9376504.1 type II toxin-antitoxin system RelE/ParE family toxin [Streptomyces sp. ZAF1911]
MTPPKPSDGYTLVIVPEVREWLHDLRKRDKKTMLMVSAAITALRDYGPGLGRPLADTLTQSVKEKRQGVPKIKELRPHSGSSSAPRILFIFDPQRQAVLLVAGDKAGNWAHWYREAIPLAHERYERHLKEAEASE